MFAGNRGEVADKKVEYMKFGELVLPEQIRPNQVKQRAKLTCNSFRNPQRKSRSDGLKPIFEMTKILVEDAKIQNKAQQLREPMHRTET